MLDINLLREEKGGNPEAVRASQRRRGARPELVDEVIAADREWVRLRFEVDEANKEGKALQARIGEIMKATKGIGNDESKALVEKREQVIKHGAEVEAAMAAKERERDEKLVRIGNIVHEAVVTSMNEDDNDVVRTWAPEGMPSGLLAPLSAEEKAASSILPHHKVLLRLGGLEQERGQKVAGHRGYFLKDAGVRLNQALINYGMDFLRGRGYGLLQTPFMMRRELMGRCAQLEEFDEQLYKVVGEASPEDDRYLIATSEQPIAAFHADEWFDAPERQLPIRYCGYSSCFRKEAGAHGRDTWGLFRVHQFEKIEQFVLCEPEASWAMLDEMVAASEAFYQSLRIPYRVVGIVSGALNNAAARKLDLEAWFPNYGAYKELVSASNCTDYQARRLGIRCGLKKLGDREKRFVHCLNATLCATERALCCVLENYQTPTGLRVPDALRPYLGTDFLPYVCDLPDSQ